MVIFLVGVVDAGFFFTGGDGSVKLFFGGMMVHAHAGSDTALLSRAS
jgi:hypothetical protein